MGAGMSIAITVALLAVNAFFVAGEFAVTSTRRSQVEPLADEGARGTRDALYALQHVSLMLAICQLGVTVASTTLGVVAEPAIAHLVESPLERLGAPEATSHVVGFAAALIIVLLRIIEASGALSLLATPMSSMERTFRDIRALVDTADTSDSIPPTGTSSDAVDVQVSDVTYHYPDTTVGINSINRALPAGSITVVVGESGSGKSTLLDVLAGLRQHDTGSIAFNGTVLDAPNRLAHTSVMFQATELRQGTLRDNVTAADANADLDSIADQVQLVDILDKLPHGWDSTVGEGGSTLSGGERQRVGLARALAKNTGLLLVDEATSALDATNEQAIVEALGRLRGHRTMVIVTHRPALVSIADTVVVLKDGAIAENGTVSELIDKGGLFTHLWQRWQDVEQWTI